MGKDEIRNYQKEELGVIPSWDDFVKSNPHKPYEQSEKYGHYNQRVTDHYNNLYAEWLNMQKQPTPSRTQTIKLTRVNKER